MAYWLLRCLVTRHYNQFSDSLPQVGWNDWTLKILHERNGMFSSLFYEKNYFKIINLLERFPLTQRIYSLRMLAFASTNKLNERSKHEVAVHKFINRRLSMQWGLETANKQITWSRVIRTEIGGSPMRTATILSLLPMILSSYGSNPALHCREPKGRKQKSS